MYLILQNIFYLQADPGAFKYFLNHPLISIGAIVLALGFLQVGSNFMKWLEGNIKDESVLKVLCIISIFGLMILYFAILYQFKEN
jgi:hypothetical protein